MLLDSARFDNIPSADRHLLYATEVNFLFSLILYYRTDCSHSFVANLPSAYSIFAAESRMGELPCIVKPEYFAVTSSARRRLVVVVFNMRTVRHT